MSGILSFSATHFKIFFYVYIYVSVGNLSITDDVHNIVALDNNVVLTAKLCHQTSLVPCSTANRSKDDLKRTADS